MLIVEELYLLLTKPTGTQERPGTPRLYGLNAAVLTDLLAAGRVTLTEEKRPRATIADATPTGHPVLDAALERLAPRDGRRLDALVTWSKLDPEQDVVTSLVEAGILERGERTMLGLGRPRTPERDASPERALRARLAAVLAGSAAASVADTTLLAILQGLDVARYVLAEEAGALRPRELKRRIAEIVEHSPAGDAVGRAVQAMNTAIMTAAIMPAIVAGGAATG